MKKFHIGKVLVTSALVGTLMAGGSVYAADSTTSLQQYVGISPDSPWYFLEKISENLQLSFASNDQVKAQLLIDDAKKKLAESQLMASQGKTSYVNSLMKAYGDTLSQAQDTVSQVSSDTSTTDTEKSDLTNSLEDAANLENEVDGAVSGDLSGDTKAAVQDNVDGAKVVANVVQGIDPKVVQELKAQDLGYGEIAKIVALAQATGKTPDEIAALLKSGQGFGDIAKQLGVQPKQLAAQVKVNRLNAELQKAQTSGNDKKVAELQKQLTKFTAKADTNNTNKLADKKAEDQTGTEDNQQTATKDGSENDQQATTNDQQTVTSDATKTEDGTQQEQQQAELKAQQEKQQAELKAKQERQQAELKAQQERQQHAQAELKAQQEKQQAELKAKQERQQAELKAQQEKQQAELKAKQVGS